MFPTDDRAVAGVNMVKRHMKPSQAAGGGGIVEKEATIHLSNLAHLTPATTNVRASEQNSWRMDVVSVLPNAPAK